MTGIRSGRRSQWTKPLRGSYQFTKVDSGLVGRSGARGWRARARMRRCLILRQGASPLKPPVPFPSDAMVGTRRNLSRVRKAAQTQRALDRFLQVRNRSSEEGKGTPVQATDCAVGPEAIHG